MSRWFRWYEGTSEDGKFRAVARNAKVTVATVMGVWAILLEDASHPEHRGVATRGEDFWGAVLGLDDADLIAILSAMEGMELISVGHGAITITKWKERQFETDTTDATNAERQRRFREKHKQTGDETPHNGSVTAEKRPDTDTDTEKKVRDASSKRGTRVPETFEPNATCWHLAEELRLTTQQSQQAFDQFMDYWRSVPGAKGLKLDWQAAFRTWLRRSVNDFGRKPNGPTQNQPSKRQQAFAALDAIVDEAYRRENGTGDSGGEIDPARAA